MRPLILSGMTALCLALPVSAQAQNNDGFAKGILDLPAGQTLINISTSERIEVDQDLLVATLRYESENKDARALQNEINEVMQKAVAAAKAVEGVKVVTQQYYVYPHDYQPIEDMRKAPDEPSKKTERIWRGNQGLEIKSTQADTLLELTGSLQDMGLVMNNLSYTLSPEKAEETRDSLMEGALEKLKAKADRAAAALGKANADLLEVNVDSGYNGPQPMPMMRTMAMESAAMDKMAAPVAEPGQTEISMTVSARALLKP